LGFRYFSNVLSSYFGFSAFTLTFMLYSYQFGSSSAFVELSRALCCIFSGTLDCFLSWFEWKFLLIVWVSFYASTKWTKKKLLKNFLLPNSVFPFVSWCSFGTLASKRRKKKCSLLFFQRQSIECSIGTCQDSPLRQNSKPQCETGQSPWQVMTH
jgi:hypothetical protein